MKREPRKTEQSRQKRCGNSSVRKPGKGNLEKEQKKNEWLKYRKGGKRAKMG